MDAAAGLLRAVDMLSSERMENQGRLLDIGSLLDELRAAATSLHTSIEARTEMLEGSPLRMLRTEVNQLRDVLEVVLRRQARAGAWYQVPALSISNLIFRRATVRKLRLSLEHLQLPLDEESAADVDDGTASLLARMGSFERAQKAWRPVGGGPVVGRAELVEKMVKVLLAGEEDGPLVVVPIVGGPGIGKTHLAGFLFNDDRVKQEYHVRRWVDVSPRFDLSKVLASLLSWPFNIAQHEEDNKYLRLALRKCLQGLSYLIVLDNVWDVGHRQEWPEWDTLMQALPPNGKIVLTSRTPAIVPRTASIVVTTIKPFFLQPLDQEFHQRFIDQYLFLHGNDSSINGNRGVSLAECGGIPPTDHRSMPGMKISKRCAGVPLLLEYTAFLLLQQEQEFFIRWQRCLEVRVQLPAMDIEIQVRESFFPSDEEPIEILDRAYASYQHLPSELRACFLYCSLFPLDYGFDADELADLLAAEGFIPSRVPEAQRIRFLQQLLDECFYPTQEPEHGGKLVFRMHQVLHIFAHYADSSSSIIRVGQSRVVQGEVQSIRSASLLINPSIESFPTYMSQFKNLRKLILLQEGEMCSSDQQCEIKEFPREFCQRLRHLQVLSLEATKIRKLPNKFELLTHVRYLNLSWTNIEFIPSSISKLQLLQTLKLSHCKKLQKNA